MAGKVPPLRQVQRVLTEERHPESAAAEETKPKAPVTYQVSEQPSTRVQEEEFAKQLRLARYLAAEGCRHRGRLRTAREPRTPKRERSVAKTGVKTKAGTVSKKAREEELAKERRRGGGWVRRCRHPVRGEGRSSGRVLGVRAGFGSTRGGGEVLLVATRPPAIKSPASPRIPLVNSAANCLFFVRHSAYRRHSHRIQKRRLMYEKSPKSPGTLRVWKISDFHKCCSNFRISTLLK